jgi:hypothetical protein
MAEYEVFSPNAEEQTTGLTLSSISHYAGMTATSVIDLKRGLGMSSMTLRYLGIESSCRTRPILALIRRIARSIISHLSNLPKPMRTKHSNGDPRHHRSCSTRTYPHTWEQNEPMNHNTKLSTPGENH